jgi:H+/Cl- antiporter ClcA
VTHPKVVALARKLQRRPLIFGGSLGPEAGLAGIIAMLFCWVRDKYKSSIIHILKNTEKNKSTRLFKLLNNPINTFISFDITYDDKTYYVSKTKRWSAYVSAAAGGTLVFRVIAKILAQGGVEIAKFDSFSYTSQEILYFFPIVILGILTGLIFLFSKKLFKYLFKPLQNKKIIRAVITGLLLGLAGTFLPYTMFSGEEQMAELVKSWQSWTALLLFATGFIKILMINCCISGGWRGGSFFPCLFSATAIGYGLSTFISANQSFIILTFMASFTAMALGQPLIIVALCMLFAPLSAILPIIIAACIGGWLNKKFKTEKRAL